MGAIYTNGEFYGGGSPGGGGSGEDYVLPPATSETLGGVKIGDGLSITKGGLLSAPQRASHTFGTDDFDISEQDEVSLDPTQRMVELTEAQYNALSSAEKYNGTAYFLSDRNGDNITEYTLSSLSNESVIDTGVASYDSVVGYVKAQYSGNTYILPIPHNFNGELMEIWTKNGSMQLHSSGMSSHTLVDGKIFVKNLVKQS